ncbi:hypothetical protein U1Q18_038660 [Sarracenia purpurea var. burkii]
MPQSSVLLWLAYQLAYTTGSTSYAKGDHPNSIDNDTAENVIRALMASKEQQFQENKNKTQGAEEGDNNGANLTDVQAEWNRRSSHFSLSSEESVAAATSGSPTPLSLTTRPSCRSSELRSGTNDFSLDPRPNVKSQPRFGNRHETRGLTKNWLVSGNPRDWKLTAGPTRGLQILWGVVRRPLMRHTLGWAPTTRNLLWWATSFSEHRAITQMIPKWFPISDFAVEIVERLFSYSRKRM